jgi:uncharacterized small protein (DUF1192 family)
MGLIELISRLAGPRDEIDRLRAEADAAAALVLALMLAKLRSLQSENDRLRAELDEKNADGS